MPPSKDPAPPSQDAAASRKPDQDDLASQLQAAILGAAEAEQAGVEAYLRLATEAVTKAAEHKERQPRWYARALTELGNAQRLSGELPEALATLAEALRVARTLAGSKEREALLGLAHHRCGIVHDTMGNPVATLEQLRMAQASYLQAEDDTGRGRVENSIGVVYSRSGDYERALDFFQCSLQQAEEDGATVRMGSILSNISISTRMLGRMEASIEAAERSLRLCDLPHNQAFCTTNLALSLAAAGRLEEAEAAFERGLALHEAFGEPSYLAEHLIGHGNLLLETQRAAQALPLLERALALADGIEAMHQVKKAHHTLYGYWKSAGDHQKALSHHEAFHQVAQRLDMDAAASELRQQKWQLQMEQAKQEAETERRNRERLAQAYAELTELHSSLSAHTLELEQQNRHDSLTGLANRRHFEERVVLEVELAELRDQPVVADEGELGLLLLDLDGFKGINDRHGHLVGDEVLRQVAALLLACVRSSDLCGRLGGEEFAVLLTHTGPSGVEKVATKLLQRIAEHPWDRVAPGLQVTTSVGGALLSETTGGVNALMALTDTRLYEAKHAGRNRAVTVLGH